MFIDITLRLVIVYDMPEEAKQQAIEDTQGALSAEALAHRLSAVLPFEQMTQAHELIEAGGTNGCIVVSVP